MIDNLMKLDDEMLMAVSGGHGRGHGHCKGKKHGRGYGVRQENTQTFTSGDITITVYGDLTGDVFIGNSASNSVA